MSVETNKSNTNRSSTGNARSMLNREFFYLNQDRSQRLNNQTHGIETKYVTCLCMNHSYRSLLHLAKEWKQTSQREKSRVSVSDSGDYSIGRNTIKRNTSFVQIIQHLLITSVNKKQFQMLLLGVWLDPTEMFKNLPISINQWNRHTWVCLVYMGTPSMLSFLSCAYI